MTPGAQIIVNYPGYALHNKRGVVVGPFDDEFCGRLWIVDCGPDFIQPALDARNLRVIEKQEAA